MSRSRRYHPYIAFSAAESGAQKAWRKECHHAWRTRVRSALAREDWDTASYDSRVSVWESPQDGRPHYFGDCLAGTCTHRWCAKGEVQKLMRK